MKLLALCTVLLVTGAWGSLFQNTCDRITSHGYPCESHVIETTDGYKLKVFRIPHSHNLNNQQDTNKSAVLIMHGLMCSSDSWILNGPNDALPFMLADAGYDVWIGNSRGNDYSQQHVSKTPLLPPYWAFSWHEMGVYDLPAKIDYILNETGQAQLHYVGHSQGGTSFMVMLSSLPTYNAKIKTSHLLAPAIYMEHMELLLAKILDKTTLDKPSLVGNLIGSTKLTLGADVLNLLLPPVCKVNPLDWCNNVLFLVGGGPSEYINETLLPDFFATAPSDCSARQLLHFLQGKDSKRFRRYDHGLLTNMAKYGTAQPPDYQLSNVNTQQPIGIYYSDNDDWVATQDILRLGGELGNRAVLHHVKYSTFSHLDFQLAENLKEVINDCVLDQMNQYEGKVFSGNLCNSFTT